MLLESQNRGSTLLAALMLQALDFKTPNSGIWWAAEEIALKSIRCPDRLLRGVPQHFSTTQLLRFMFCTPTELVQHLMRSPKSAEAFSGPACVWEFVGSRFLTARILKLNSAPCGLCKRRTLPPTSRNPLLPPTLYPGLPKSYKAFVCAQRPATSRSFSSLLSAQPARLEWVWA